jgi:hypothetical protein
MSIDIHVKSHQLLEMLANSVHDRDPKSTNYFFFNIADIHAAERWLIDFIEEIKKDCECV